MNYEAGCTADHSFGEDQRFCVEWPDVDILGQLNAFFNRYILFKDNQNYHTSRLLYMHLFRFNI